MTPVITDQDTGRILWRGVDCATHVGIQPNTWRTYVSSLMMLTFESIVQVFIWCIDMDRKVKGEDVYISGALSDAPGGTMRLPGTLARTRIVSGEDVRGRSFAAIVDDPV